jgi:hypothetical protein
MRKEMTIVAATHGGFLVYDLTTGSKDVQPLFAGNIGEALGFIRTAFQGNTTLCPTAYKELLKAQTMGASKNTPDFLDWVADRLVTVYKDDSNVDFVLSLRERARQGRLGLTAHESSQVRLAS